VYFFGNIGDIGANSVAKYLLGGLMYGCMGNFEKDGRANLLFCGQTMVWQAHQSQHQM